MSTPAILIAGQASGVGKTVVTLGLIAALRKRGLTVQPFKCGPDYIDPTYHTLAAGRPCRTLDTWMLSPKQMVTSFQRASRGADIAIIEGVMGLFDGSSYRDENGSAAQIAKLLNIPTLLVLDIGKLARSAGALALGYARFDPTLRIAGFILNRAGSQSHANGCTAAIEQATGLPVIGWLSKDSALHIPERHLGLVPTGERGTNQPESAELSALVETASDAVFATFDLERIIEIAKAKNGEQKGTLPAPVVLPTPASSIAPAPILAVARDEAFSFYYPDNLDLLEAAGARIEFFSPLRDTSLPTGAAGLYLGGGFPELYASQLSANQSILAEFRRFHAQGRPIYAECGGFMVLTQALIEPNGTRWPMAGIIPGETQMQERLAGLGYRVATAMQDNLLINRGECVRGHEFHYSRWTDESGTNDSARADTAWQMRRRSDDSQSRAAGYSSGNLLASYLHIHFGQDPALAQNFVSRLMQQPSDAKSMGRRSSNHVSN